MRKPRYTISEMLDRKTLERSLEIAKMEMVANPTIRTIAEVKQLERIISKLKK